MSNNDRRDGYNRGRRRGYIQRGRGQFQRGRRGGNWRNKGNNFNKNQDEHILQGREWENSPRPEVEYMDDNPINRGGFSPRWENDSQEEYEERNAVYYEDELVEEEDGFLRERLNDRFIVEGRISEGRDSRDRNHSPSFHRDLRDDMSRRSGRSWDDREDFVDDRRRERDHHYRDDFRDDRDSLHDNRSRSHDRDGYENRSIYSDNFEDFRDGGKRDIHENLSPDDQYDRVSEYEEVSEYDQVSEYDDVSEYDEVSEYETVSEDDDFPENSSGFNKSQNSRHRNRPKRRWSPTNDQGPGREREFHDMPQVGPDGQIPPGMQVMGEPSMGQVIVDERQGDRGFRGRGRNRGRFNAHGRGRGRFNRNDDFQREVPMAEQPNSGQVVLDPNMIPVGVPNIIGPGMPIVNVPGGMPMIMDPNMMPPGNIVQQVLVPIQGMDQPINDQAMKQMDERFPDRDKPRENRSHDRDNRHRDLFHHNNDGRHRDKKFNTRRNDDGRYNDRHNDRNRDRRQTDNRYRDSNQSRGSSESRGRHQGRHSSKERSREKKSSEDFSKQLKDVISGQKKSAERNDDAMISLLKSALDVMQEKIRKKESSKSSDSKSGQSKSSSSGSKPRESSSSKQNKPGEKRSLSSSDDKRDAKKPRIEEKKQTGGTDSSDTKDKTSAIQSKSTVAEKKETETNEKKSVKKETESTKPKLEKKEIKATDIKQENKDASSPEVLEANPNLIKNMSEKLEAMLEKQKEGGKVDDNMVTLLRSALDVAKKRTGDKTEKVSEKSKPVPKQPPKPVKFSIKGQEKEPELQKSAVQETWMTEIIDSEEENIEEDAEEKSKEDDLKARASALLQGKKKKEEPIKLDITAIQTKDQEEKDTSIIKRNKLPPKDHLRKQNQNIEDDHENEQAIMVRIGDRRKTDKEKQHEKSETANKQSHNTGKAIQVIGKSQSQPQKPQAWVQTGHSVHSAPPVVPSQFSRPPPPTVQPQYSVPQGLQVPRPAAAFSQPPKAVLPSLVVPQVMAQPPVPLQTHPQQPPVAVQPFVPRPPMLNPQSMATTIPTSQFLEQLATVATKMLPQLATVAATASAIAPRLQQPVMNIPHQPSPLMSLVANTQRPALQHPVAATQHLALRQPVAATQHPALRQPAAAVHPVGLVSHAPVMNQPPQLSTTKDTSLPSGPLKEGVSEDLLRIQQRAIEVMAKEKREEEEAKRNKMGLQSNIVSSQSSQPVSQPSSTGTCANKDNIGQKTPTVPPNSIAQPYSVYSQTNMAQQNQGVSYASHGVQHAVGQTVVAQQPSGVPPVTSMITSQLSSASHSQAPVQPLFPVAQANINHVQASNSSNAPVAVAPPFSGLAGSTVSAGQLQQGHPRKDESTFPDYSVSKPPQKYDNKNKKRGEQKSNEKKMYTAAEILERISAAKAKKAEELRKEQEKKEKKPATTVITTNQGVKKTVLVSEAKAFKKGLKPKTGTPLGNKTNKSNAGKSVIIGKKTTQAKPLWKPEPTKIEEKKDTTASLNKYKSVTGEVIKNIPTIENRSTNTGLKNTLKPPISAMSNLPPNQFPNFSTPPPLVPMQNIPRPGDPRMNVPGFTGPPRFGVPNVPDLSRQRLMPPPGIPPPTVAYPHLQQIARPPLFPAAIPPSMPSQGNQVPVSGSAVVQTTLQKQQPLVPYTSSPPRDETEKKLIALREYSSRGRSPTQRYRDDRELSKLSDRRRNRNESPKRQSSGRSLSPEGYADHDHHRRSLTPTRPDYDLYGRSPAYRELSPRRFDSSYRVYDRERRRSLSPSRLPYPDRGDISPRYMYSDQYHLHDIPYGSNNSPQYRKSPDPHRYREPSPAGYSDRYQELHYPRSPHQRYDSSPPRRHHSPVRRRHSLSPPRRNDSPSRRRELSPFRRHSSNRSISPSYRSSRSPDSRRSPSGRSRSPLHRRVDSPISRRSGSSPRRGHSPSSRRYSSPYSMRRSSLSPRRSVSPLSRRRDSLSPRRPGSPHLQRSPLSRRRDSLSPRRPGSPHLQRSDSRSPLSSSFRRESLSPSSAYKQKYLSSPYHQYSSMPQEHRHSPLHHRHTQDSSSAMDQQTTKVSDRYRRSLSPIYRKAYSSSTLPKQETEKSGNIVPTSMTNQSPHQYSKLNSNSSVTTQNVDTPLPGVLTNLLKNLGSSREINYKPMSKSMADLLGNVQASNPPECKPQGTYPVGILKKPGNTQKPATTESSSILEPSGKLPEHLFQKLSAWIPNAFGQSQGQSGGHVTGQNTSQTLSPLKTPDSSYSQLSYLEETKSNIGMSGGQRSTGMEDSYQSFLDVIGYKKKDTPSDPKIPGLDDSIEGKKDTSFVVPVKPQQQSYIDMYTTKSQSTVPGLGQSPVQNNTQNSALFNRPISYNRPGVFPSAARLQQILRK